MWPSDPSPVKRRGRIIVAMTADGAIGLNGKIPWHYSADMRRFKRLTLNSTVIMGRKTWESLNIRPLPERQNIVVTRDRRVEAECYPSLQLALEHARHDSVWFIGGAAIYQEAVNYCDSLEITHVPDNVQDQNAVRFPPIDWSRWTAHPKLQFEDDARLYHQQFTLRE